LGTRRSSEREPADSLRDELNIIGGWLPSLELGRTLGMTPPTAQIEWSWNDGWLLMALLLAEGETGARLNDLIGAADATNHAIPTSSELSSALTKLFQCGLVTITGDRYMLSSSHRLSLQKAYRGRGGLFAAGEKGLRWLKGSGLAPVNMARVDLSEVQVKAAYKQYVSALRAK
jgi:hypothetical protein